MPQALPKWRDDFNQLREFAGIRLVVVDLDGSFVRPTAGQVFPSLRTLNRSLSRYGIALTIATGRAWSGAHQLVSSLSIAKGMPLILYNGALVVEHNNLSILQRKTIPLRVVEIVAKLCRDAGANLLAYSFEDPLVAGFNGRSLESVFGLGPSFPNVDFNCLPVADWSDRSLTSDTYTALVVEPKVSSTTEHLRSELKQLTSVSCTVSGDRYIEIRPNAANKGNALNIVRDYLGVRREQILALGDHENDVEMLEVAGIGVCVMGASSAAQRASKYVSRYGAAEGAVEIMRLIKHAKRFFALSHK